MRSEKEIRDRIAYLQQMVQEEVEHIRLLEEDSEDGEIMCDIAISVAERINSYQSEQYHLRWALGDV